MLNTSLSKSRTLAELASLLNGEVEGDGDFEVHAVAHPALAESAQTLALAMDEGSLAALTVSPARAAVVTGEAPIDTGSLAGGIRVPRMRLALAQLLELFPRPPMAAPGVHPSAVVEESAELGSDVSVGPLSYIGPEVRVGAATTILAHASIGAGATIGEGCLIHAGARIGERVAIGNGCILQSNAVIGADGFGYVTPEEGSVEAAKKRGMTGSFVEAKNTELVRINSIGSVVLGDNVDVGANACIDRGTLGPTRIGNGTRIDNLVQVAHNCTIGENCLIAGMVGISGSANIGDRVVLAGGVGIADYVRIGEDSIIVARSGVHSDVPAGEIWGGYPAKRKDQATNELVSVTRIPRMIRELQALKRDVAQLKKSD